MAGIMLEGEHVSDEQRAEFARAFAAERREAARLRHAQEWGPIREQLLDAATRVGGRILRDEVVAPGGYSSLVMRLGERLRIIDLEGRQAVDFLCYDRQDPQNRYNAANTIKVNRSIYLGLGFRLYSDFGDVLMSVVEDTVGNHDTIGGCCSARMNYLRYGIEHTPNCRDNFIAALAPHGLGPRDIPANVNFFMRVPVLPSGEAEIQEGTSRPGDFVDLQADRDVLVAISNCPQVYNPCNGWDPTPIRLIAWTAQP